MGVEKEVIRVVNQSIEFLGGLDIIISNAVRMVSDRITVVTSNLWLTQPAGMDPIFRAQRLVLHGR